MVKRIPLKDKVFVSKISKTTSTSTNSLRTIIPFDLLSKLKMAAGDQLCWKLDEKNVVKIWKRTKKDKIAAEKIIDIKESGVTIEAGKPVSVKSTNMSTQGTETQPQITATSHI